jgi:hypothetical protein
VCIRTDTYGVLKIEIKGQTKWVVLLVGGEARFFAIFIRTICWYLLRYLSPFAKGVGLLEGVRFIAPFLKEKGDVWW